MATLGGLLALGGCRTPDLPPAQPEILPTYEQVVERYNQHLVGLNSLRATLTVTFTWQNEDGRNTEQSDGQLMIGMPYRLMLSIDHTFRSGPLFWAGSNQEFYWVFDLRDRERKEVFFGRQAKFTQRRVGDLDLPMHPRQLPQLLGIVRLAHGPSPNGPKVKWRDGCFVVDLVESDGTNSRIWIDPKKYHAVRVDILDAKGRSLVTSRLSQPHPVTIEGRPPDGKTKVATSVEITRPGREERLKLRLGPDSLSDGPIEDKYFQFEKLKNLFKPHQVHNLDARVKDNKFSPQSTQVDADNEEQENE